MSLNARAELYLRAKSNPADLLTDPLFELYSLENPLAWRLLRARAQIALLRPLWRSALPRLSKSQLERSLLALRPLLHARIDRTYDRESDRRLARRVLELLFAPPYDETVLRDRAMTAILNASGVPVAHQDDPQYFEDYARFLEAIGREFVGACLESDSRAARLEES